MIFVCCMHWHSRAYYPLINFLMLILMTVKLSLCVPLQPALSTDVLEAMDKFYGFNKSENAEVKFRLALWCKIIIMCNMYTCCCYLLCTIHCHRNVVEEVFSVLFHLICTLPMLCTYNKIWSIFTQVAETLLEGQMDSSLFSGDRHTLQRGQNEVHHPTIQVHECRYFCSTSRSFSLDLEFK